MLSYGYLLDLALILLSTKLLGIITKKFKMPQVVGALLAGLIFGPAMLNILKETNFIIQLSELGVILLMFSAGLDTDLNELKKYLFSDLDLMKEATTNVLLQNIFIGVILTATSVSITVEALKEMGKLNTSAGTAILGAAIIDDILGIIALTIIISIADTSVNFGFLLLKIVAYFIFVIVIGITSHK